MFENCLAWQRLTCALARGAHYIRRPLALQQKSREKERFFLGSFTYWQASRCRFPCDASSIRRTPRQEIPMLQTLSCQRCLLVSHHGDGRRCRPRSRAPGEPEFRALYKELVETNTTLSNGSCTLAAERMAARLKAAGIEQAQVFTAPDHPEGRRPGRRAIPAAIRRPRRSCCWRTSTWSKRSARTGPATRSCWSRRTASSMRAARWTTRPRPPSGSTR